MNLPMRTFLHLARLAVLAMSCIQVPLAHAGLFNSLNNKVTATMSDQPRYEKLPLFNPHRKDFTCVYQAQKVPALDPQAEMWFQQALALDDPNVVDIDYAKMYQLYLQAAERGHWKAMLNLASLILGDEQAVPEHNPEAAIRWVEKAMKLGVPDAYDRMGVYHLNGVVKGGNATSAYAFFERAADMGSPSAMTFLGDKLAGTYDDPEGEFWGNLPIATQMLECAVAQGYGPAAFKLGYIYKRPNTPEAKARALRVFQDGIKQGCAKCADKLSVDFDGAYLTDGSNLVPTIDKARSERYSKIGDILKLYQGRLKLPNLDKVLPLPPAPLPKWDGKAQTLIDAAKGVTPAPTQQQGAALQRREFIPQTHGVSPLAESTIAVAGNQVVPRDGYWLALYGSPSADRAQLLPARRGTPERYQAGERFEASSFDWLAADQVQWHYLGEAHVLPPQREDFLKHLIDAGFMRELPQPSSSVRCNGQQRCTQSGIWEGRVGGDHPLAALYNRWDQQAFVEKGQAFPKPGDRFLDIAINDVRWTYLGSPNEENGGPGIYQITL